MKRYILGITLPFAALSLLLFLSQNRSGGDPSWEAPSSLPPASSPVEAGENGLPEELPSPETGEDPAVVVNTPSPTVWEPERKERKILSGQKRELLDLLAIGEVDPRTTEKQKEQIRELIQVIRDETQ